jgi:hypothetical protein
MVDLHPRRYVFRGHSSGVAAHIRRPEKHVLPVQGCSSLPVTGGLSESKLGPIQLGKWVSFDAVATSAHGDYVDAEAGIATTRGEVAFDAVPTMTHVTSSVHGLVILGRVHIGYAAMGLISRSAEGKSQPVIRTEGNRLEDVRIDDSRLKITLAEEFYRECDTRDKLAARHASGLPHHHARMFLPHTKAAQPTGANEFPEANGIVKCTIVQEIAWDGTPHPTAEIHGHVVRVPNFGRIYFGEMFITDHSRRLTMVRFQLGSDDGGEVTAAEGETNGSSWPPTPPAEPTP